MTETYRATMLKDKTSSARSTLEGTSQKIRALLLERRQALAETRQDRRLSEEYRHEQMQAQEKQFAKKLQEIRADAQRAHDKMLEVAREPIADNRSPEEQVLAELKEQRVWARYVRLLDAETEPFELVQRLAESEDAPGLRAMREELPAYLEAQEWAPQHIQAITEQITRAETPLLPPEERAARELEEEAEAGWQRLEIAFAHAQADLDGSIVETTTLPVWEGGTIPVSEQGAA